MLAAIREGQLRDCICVRTTVSDEVERQLVLCFMLGLESDESIGDIECRSSMPSRCSICVPVACDQRHTTEPTAEL